MRKTPLVLALALLAGCAGHRTAEEPVAGLRAGMAPEQVAAVLGWPDGSRRLGHLVGYTYSGRTLPGRGRADYYAIFGAGRLDAWGPGDIRPAPGPAPRTFVIVPAAS
jgi:hypothetical protein